MLAHPHMLPTHGHKPNTMHVFMTFKTLLSRVLNLLIISAVTLDVPVKMPAK